MNNKTIVLSLIAVLFGFVHDANAFYNPSSGRWLSRDPIEEPQYKIFSTSRSLHSKERIIYNTYNFLMNETITTVDYLGFFCQCIVQQPIAIYIVAPAKARYNLPDMVRVRIEMEAYYLTSKCCHFRRWVKGHCIYNNKAVPFFSGSGDLINDNTYVQDGPDDADNESTTSYAYIGADIPGFDNVLATYDIDYSIDFKYQIIDSCNNNKVVYERDGFNLSIYGTYGPYKRIISTSGFDHE